MTDRMRRITGAVLCWIAALTISACNPPPTLVPETPTVTATCTAAVTPTVTPSSTATATGTPTATHTMTPIATSTVTVTPTGTPTEVSLACYNYWQNCLPMLTCPAGMVRDDGECGIGFICCLPATGSVTPTKAPTRTPDVSPTPTRTPGAVNVLSPPAGAYLQYDWQCGYPLALGTMPNGTKAMLCPNGLWADGTFRDTSAFRTAGGLDWDKMRAYEPSADYVRLGGVYWVAWKDINPGEGSYNWKVIDDYVAAATLLTMDTPDGPRQKGVVIRLFNSLSNRPALHPPVTGIDGGFILDDYTPAYVKAQMRGPVTWGGPTVLATGKKVTQDDGSYWVRASCLPYQDYQASHPQGSNWDYSIWVVPKYDRIEWRRAAERALHDIAAHYDGSGVVFMLGLNGVDGEYGNYLQDSFAGCGGLRQSLGQQYGVSSGTMNWTGQVAAWRSGSKTVNTWVSCTSDCNPLGFIDQNVGLFQARAVADGPNYHRAGGAYGVLDWMLEWNRRGLPVAMENAHGFADTPYLYQMFSVIAPTWPQWFSLVGGSWSNSTMVRSLVDDVVGQSITTTNAVWWRAYQTCYGDPDLIDCLDTSQDTGNWAMYQGWPGDAERGLTTVSVMPLVNPWTDLTPGQRSHPWAKMLRALPASAVWTPDARWQAGQERGHVISIEYLDVGTGDVTLSWGSAVTATITRKGSGAYLVHTQDVTSTVRLVRLAVQPGGGPLYLHGVRVEAKP